MPMIDVYATTGTFADKHQLAVALATAVMAVEQVPDIPMFRQNTAAFVHELPAGSLSNVDGDGNYVRIQVLTNAGALDRGKQLAVVERLTAISSAMARESPGSGDDLSPAGRRAWVHREGSHGRQGTCPEIQGRYRDITSCRRRQRPGPA